MIRGLRLAALVVRYTVEDIASIARKRLHRAVDELLHGAPCRCCWQDDCWAEPGADTKEKAQ